MSKASIVLIATKPFVIKNVLMKLRIKLETILLFQSLAGVSLKFYESTLPNTRVIRVMPNTPALVEEGMSAVCKGPFAYDYDAEFVFNMFSKAWQAIYIDEKDIDVVTAAYPVQVRHFIIILLKRLRKQGKKLGLDYKTALELSAQTAFRLSKNDV